jgi:ABC-2 type transport system ATP-binding protein
MNFSSPYVDLPQRLTVRENLLVYAKLYGLRQPGASVDKMLQAFQLEEFSERRLRKLSAGQKTRVSLAKALINKPELLLLEEPTASLDPETAGWVRKLLQDYQKEEGATILLASHDMKEVEQLCQKVILLRKGELVEKGSPVELLTKYDRQTMEDVFLDVSKGASQ